MVIFLDVILDTDQLSIYATSPELRARIISILNNPNLAESVLQLELLKKETLHLRGNNFIISPCLYSQKTSTLP